MKWVTNSGDELEISEMTDGHLVNTIRMLRDKADTFIFRAYEREFNTQAYTNSQAWVEDKTTFELPEFHTLGVPEGIAVDDDELDLRYYVMCMEAKKRGLNYGINYDERRQKACKGGYYADYYGRSARRATVFSTGRGPYIR